jgi:hypothetical protein
MEKTPIAGEGGGEEDRVNYEMKIFELSSIKIPLKM